MRCGVEGGGEGLGIEVRCSRVEVWVRGSGVAVEVGGAKYGGSESG